MHSILVWDGGAAITTLAPFVREADRGREVIRGSDSNADLCVAVFPWNRVLVRSADHDRDFVRMSAAPLMY